MSTLNFVEVRSPREGAQYLFELLSKELDSNRLHVLGLATGGTMIPVYEQCVASNLDFSDVVTFNLDEYVGLSAENPNSYAYFMEEHLFSKKKFRETHFLNGLAKELERECERYEELLQKYPLDIQLLGVGENGHIAFNEPGTPFDSVTHVAELTDSTLQVNSRFFDNEEEIPSTALTMGISSIMRAKKIVLVAFGEKKRAAVAKLLDGDIDPKWPITKLLQHEDLVVITDLKVK